MVHSCRASVILLVALTLSAPPVRAGDDPAPSRLSVAYTQFTLPNGLRVMLHEDHSVPVVAVNVWYHAGSDARSRGVPGSRTSSST